MASRISLAKTTVYRSAPVDRSDERMVSYIDRCVAGYELTNAVRAVAVLQPLVQRALGPSLRLSIANLYALAGRYREMATVLGLQPVAPSTDRGRELLVPAQGTRAEHAHILAIGLSERGSREAAYEMFAHAISFAQEEERPHLAIAFLESCARHAVRFGDLTIAFELIAQAKLFAWEAKLMRWWTRCTITEARLALASGNVAEAQRALDEATADADHRDLWIIAAPTAVALALQRNDEASLRSWTSEETLAIAQYSTDRLAVVSASTALLLAANGGELSDQVIWAIERTLQQIDSAGEALELLVRATERAGMHIAKYAIAHLRCASRHPEHRMTVAAYDLARANVAARNRRRDESRIFAANAARAFREIGLNPWASAALDLIVFGHPLP